MNGNQPQPDDRIQTTPIGEAALASTYTEAVTYVAIGLSLEMTEAAILELADVLETECPWLRRMNRDVHQGYLRWRR